MKNERELLDKLYQLLLSKGFPKDQLVREFPINQNFRSDLAVIDPDTDEILGIFELKLEKNSNAVNDVISQFRQYENIVAKNIYKFAVFQENDKFVFYLFDAVKLIEINDLPNYEILKAVTKENKKRNLTDNRDSAINSLEKYSKIGCFSSLLILLLHFCKIVEITPEDIVLIGFVVLLPLLPYASKIKIFGIELNLRNCHSKIADK